MGLLDFSEERRRVEIDGRRFVIRRITVGGVVRALTLYAREIAALRSLEQHEPGNFAKFGPAYGLLFLPADDRMLAVIRDCVETDEPEGAWPLAQLAEEIVKLSDWKRIVASFQWSETPGLPEDAEAENRAIVGIAKAAGASPVEILSWPYEAWIATVEALQPPQPKAVDPAFLESVFSEPAPAPDAVQ